MDFHNMKRKQLQALCKKHNIPANLSNLEMANKLTEFLKEKEDPLIRRVIKGKDENVTAAESADVIVNRKIKKVRFSPEHELIEFTRSVAIKRRSKRNSVLNRNSSLSVEDSNSAEMNKENMGGPGRTTRSRGLKSMEPKVDAKKRGRNPVNCIDVKTDASAIELFDNGELKEGNVDSSGRVILLRGKMLEDGVKDASRRGRKRAKDDNSIDEKASDHVDNGKAKLIQQIVDNPGRLTRSRVQKLTEVSAREEKTGRKVAASIRNVALVRTENDENRVASTSSFMNRGDVCEGQLARQSGERVKSNGKGWEEILKNKKIAGDNDMIEPQILLRRSKRNVNKVSDSEILNADTGKHENGEAKGLRIKSKLLPSEGSGVDGATTGSEVNLGRRVVLKTEEPVKVELRRSNRRKNLIESDEPKAGTENRHTLRSSVSQLEIADDVSKDQKNILPPTEVARRSERKTSSVKLVSAVEEIKTDSALENLEAEKTGSEPCLVEKECSAVPKNTRRSKRNTSKCKSPGPVNGIGRDVVKSKNNPCTVAQCMKESNRKQAAPAASTGKIAEKRKRTCRLNDPKMSEASLHYSLKIGEACFMDAQLSVSECLGSSSKSAFRTSAKNIISDGGLTFSRKTHRKKPNISTADSAGNSKMKLISGEEMANSDKNAASRITELRTNSADFEDRNSASNIRGVEKGHSPLLFDMRELIEQNIIAMDKNDPEAQVSSPTEDSGCDNKIDNQVLPEGLNASGDEVFAETNSSADSILLDDQTDIKTDLEKAENEADKYLPPNPSVIGHVGEVQGTSVHEILDTDETRQDSHVFPEGSNVSGNEADLEAAEAEAYKCLQPGPTLIDHVGQVEGIYFHEILDTDGTIQENQVFSEGLNISGKEGLAETVSSADKLLPNVRTADLKEAGNEEDKCLPLIPCVIGHVVEIQGTSIHEILDTDETRQDNHVLPEGSNVSGKEGFAEIVSASDKLLPDVRRADLEVTEAEAYKCLQPSLTLADRVGQVTGISFHEILDNDEAIQTHQEFPEGSNVSGKEGLAETASSDYKLLPNVPTANLEVEEVEADKCLQLSPGLVYHVGQVKGISVHEILDADEKRQDNQLLPEGSVSGKESFAETNSSAAKLLPDFQTADLEVAEAAADKCLQPSRTLVYHGGEVKGTCVQEYQESDETRQANGIRSPISSHHIYVDHLDASSNILDNSNEDASPKSGEAGAFESCEKRIDYPHSKSKLQLEEPSSGMLRRLEGDNMTEGNETYSLKGIRSELAESNEHRFLNNNKIVTCQYSELDVHDLSDGERSAGLVPQDKLVISNEYSVKSSDEQGKCRSSSAVAPITISTNSTESNLKRGHEANDHRPKKEETHIGKSTNSEDGGTDKGGSSEGDKSTSDEDGEFIVCNLDDAEGRLRIMPQDKEVISGEHSVKYFDDQGMFHGSPTEEPITMYNLARDHEKNLIAEGKEAYVNKEKQSESVDADESGCLKGRMSSEDEDWNFTLSNLFDNEKSVKITQQDRGTVSAEYSINDFNEQVMFPDFPAASITCANYNEVELSADISNFQEKSSSKTFTFSGSQAAAEHPKSPLSKRTAFANTIQRLEAWSNASETAGNAMCLIKTNAKQNTCQVVEGSSIDEDANYAKSGQGEEEFAGPVVGEEPTDVKSSQSWTEIEPHSLLGKTLDSDTPGLNDTFSQGTEIANLTMSTNKSTSKFHGILTKKKGKDLEEGERSVCSKVMNRSMVRPTTLKEVPHTGSNVNKEGNQLEAPIQIVAPCNMDETSSHERKLDRNVTSIMECFDTMKENAATQNKPNEKVQESGYELENIFHLGDPLSDNGEDATRRELNEIDNVELVSEARYDTSEASQEQLTEMIHICLKETSLITEDKEEKVISLCQSCLNDEATNNDSELTEKNIIRSSGSPRSLDKFEGCPYMLTDTDLSESLSCKSRIHHKSDGDTDLRKSNVPENSRHLTGYFEDGNILWEKSIQTCGGPLDAEVAKVGCFRKEATEKGFSHCLSLEASTDYDKVTERKGPIREEDNPSGANIWDETDNNRRSSQDISDELHANSEVAIPKSLSIDYHLCQEANQLPNSLELENTCREAKETGTTTQNVDHLVAAAEHGLSVYGAVSGNVSSSTMHLHLDHECGDFEELEVGTPVFNLEGYQEKNGKEAEESSIANIVQFSIQEFHYEEKVEEDLNNDIGTIANVPASGCNEILKESVVADTTKEYIDSETYMSVIFENSSFSPSINALAHTDEMTAAACENAPSCKNEEDVAGRLANTECEGDKPSVDSLGIEIKELGKATLSMEPPPGSMKSVMSPARVDFLPEGYSLIEPLVEETKGSAVESQKQIESEDGDRCSSKQLCSISKKNARTILILGTPGKFVTMSDMKENAPTGKSSNVGDCTTVRPVKRKALQDVAWK